MGSRWESAKLKVMIVTGALVVFGSIGAGIEFGLKLWHRRAEVCAADLQGDLDRVVPDLNPAVENCRPGAGDGGKALCFVRLLRDGQYATRSVARSCKGRQIPDKVTTLTAFNDRFLAGKMSKAEALDLDSINSVGMDLIAQTARYRDGSPTGVAITNPKDFVPAASPFDPDAYLAKKEHEERHKAVLTRDQFIQQFGYDPENRPSGAPRP